MKIAFGSCYGIWDFESNIFETIVKDKPDLWIWLGDVAYVDAPDIISMGLRPTKGTSAKFVSERLRMTKEDAPGYARLRSETKIIGTWDDHDYGQNDSGKDFE